MKKGWFPIYLAGVIVAMFDSQDEAWDYVLELGRDYSRGEPLYFDAEELKKGVLAWEKLRKENYDG